MHVIDFTEIEDGDTFEDLVFELLSQKETVKKLQKTGKGNDLGADLIFDLEVPDSVLSLSENYKVIVECKHYATSNKNVNKGDILIFESLAHHHADTYFLVTSTRVGASVTKTFNEAQNHPEFKHLKFKYWDKISLERELVKDCNKDITSRYFPISYKRIIELKSLSENNHQMLMKKAIEEVIEEVPKGNIKEEKMKNFYIIRNSSEKNLLQESSLKKIANKNGISLKTSNDVIDDWLFSYDKIVNYDRFIKNSDAVFGVITPESAKSPHVWIEIERANSDGKLKLLFIDESIYSITLHNRYPCVILKKNLELTISDFENYFRTVFQSWGNENILLFWFALDILLSFFASKTIS